MTGLGSNPSNKRCPGLTGKCGKIMPYWDSHVVCRSCRGYACSRNSPCEVCTNWSEDLWRKFDKCLHRAAQARSALKSRHSLSQAPEKGPEKSLSTVTSSQAPAQGPGLIVSLPSDSDLASANTITRLVEQDNNRELDSDLVLQAPGNNVTPAHLTNPPRKSASPEGSFYSNRSVSPMETVTVHTRPVPRQYAIQRSNRSPSDSNQRSKRHRHRSRSLSSDERSSSSRGRSRHDKRKNRKSRHLSRSASSRLGHSRHSRYHRSRSRSSRFRSRSPRLRLPRSRSPRFRSPRSRSPRSRSPRSRSPRSRSPRSRSPRIRNRGLRRERLHRSRSVSRRRDNPAFSTLTTLVEQQGQMLKELSNRLDKFSSTPTKAAAGKVTVTGVGTRRSLSGHKSQDDESDSEQLQLHVGENETIGDSDLEHEEKEEESPKESLSYKEAISKLRSRLGSAICPTPEAIHKTVGASALEFFKDPEQNEETSLALPQSNSVSVSLSRMSKRLKGEEEVPMAPLPSYPKGFKSGSFVALNSKPKIFQSSSYESLNPVFNVDPPSVNPGLKDVMKQGSSVPSSQSVQFSTLENWEKLARTAMQVASHSELFLCGTLKTMQQDSLSKDDLLEVSRYLQAVAVSQSHLIEILCRLSSGPLLARRDACLAVTDLDFDIKQSLRVQPIESSTIFGEKFPEIVKHYKEGLAHKSLQMAVVGASKPQSSGFKKKSPKVTETTTKPTYGGLNVSVGPNATRTSSVPQGRQYPPQRPPRRNPGNPGQNKGPRKGKAPRANAP